MLELKIQNFAEGEEEEQQNMEQVYLDQIEELKNKLENDMISKEEYNKLLAENKKLLSDYINRRPAPRQQEVIIRPAREIAKELKDISSGDITNRKYVEKALEYRSAYMKETGKDPFADFSQDGSGKPTEDTNEVANVLQQLLEENPSDIDFRIKLNSILEDDPQLISKIRKRSRA